ncbi:Glutamate-1-semialdehyde 2,1-aminomutase [bioreactor metagenome]|uniref:glutamate-1-semialdehyde 2,1-aminomutase n=1 Tax=bioreactor metagenome TaxID=1076179 RepID=A0A644V800_9ZZZZ|nr:glutamate-1-semialdehyde 2,1-aminomutase [Methanocorpusculum sp.]
MKSEELFNTAKTCLPGGVSSPVRAIKPYPFYVESASGAILKTEDGEALVDCCMGYGPLLLGHAHPVIQKAIDAQLDAGWLYGTPTKLEIDLAQRIIRDHDSIEMLRFVSTGLEATLAAIRVARGFTERSGIVKIEGGFHGAHDAVLIAAGSGATTHGTPDSLGVPPSFAAHTRQVPYNDPEALEELLSKDRDIAAFILEPVMGNVGPVLPDDGYLSAVREITAAHDVLLIFDEVITGYRLGIGGAQKKYSIKPDLTTLGKITGGGLPIGVFGGRRDIMELISPSGGVYNAGTFNGNPLSMAAGIATNVYLHENESLYAKLDEKTRAIEESLPANTPGSFVRLGSLFKYFFRSTAPRNYLEAKESDTAAFRIFFEHALKDGVFIPPSQFETNFLSTAHDPSSMEKIISVYQHV